MKRKKLKLKRSVKKEKHSYTKAEAVTRPEREVSFQATADVEAEFNLGDELFNQFKIIDIKKGGMGLVYIAVDTQTNDLIAIKTFKKRFLQDDRVVDAFLREAETWVNLGKHTNLVWAQQIKRIDGKPYIFLEYVDGGNLEERINSGNITTEKALDYAIQFCTGMDFAHKKLGTVHRDIKPLNIMLTSNDTVKITDFGLVKTAEHLGTSEFLTAQYASPEQVREGRKKGAESKLDTRSDIYSFGLVLYNILTNDKMPFIKSADESWGHCQLNKQPKNLLYYNPDLPDDLCNIVMRTLNKDPAERYQNFSELQDDLIKIYYGQTGEQYIIQGREEPTAVLRIEFSQVELGLSAKQYGKYDTALNYYEKALKRYRDSNNKSGISACLSNIGMIYKTRGDYDTALGHSQRALEIAEELGIKSGMATGYNNIGSIYDARGEYDTALSHYQRALKIDEELGDKSGMATRYNNIGVIYDTRGDHDTALSYYQRALKIAEELGDKSGMATRYNNIGMIYDARGDYDKALSYYQHALKISEELGDRSSVATLLNNIGEIYRAHGDYDSALSYYQRALKISEEIGDKSGMATRYNNIGLIYKARGDYDTALSYYQRALMIDEEIGDRSVMATLYSNIGEIYRARGDYNTALSYYQRALKIAEELGDKSGMVAFYPNIGFIYYTQGDYRTAMNYLQKTLVIEKQIGVDTSETIKKKYICKQAIERKVPK